MRDITKTKALSDKLYFYYVAIIFVGVVALISFLGWILPCGAPGMCGPEWPFPVVLFLSIFLFSFLINQIREVKKKIKEKEDV